jgi:hypothetical protein
MIIHSVVVEVLEVLQGHLGGDDLLALALAVIVLLLLGLVRGGQLEALLADGVGLDVAAAAVGDLGLLLGVLLGHVLLADGAAARHAPDLVEALLGVLCAHGIRPVWVVLRVSVSTGAPHSARVFTRKTYVVGQDQAAVEAHRLEQLLDLDDEACTVSISSQ